MNSNQTFSSATYQEIISQTDAWAEAVAVVQTQRLSLLELWKTGQFTRVLFTGCGSTYYLSLAAAAVFQELVGVPSQAVPGGELWLSPRVSYTQGEKVLLVAISRSGSTTETIEAVRKFQNDAVGQVIVITNYPDSPLAVLGNISISIPKGQERSIAQTRSFASMYVAVTALSTLIANRADLLENMSELPQIGERLIQKYIGLGRSIGENLALDRFYFLGSGSRYGLACEVNLKMKEMTLTISEPFHFLEFRHGPMSMVTDATMVVGFLSDCNREHEIAVLEEMKSLGGTVLSLGNTNADIEFEPQIPEAVRNVLYLPIMQLMAYFRAVAKGLDPDNPRNLTAVVHLTTEELSSR